jgi:SAM-dependent methyltransferase
MLSRSLPGIPATRATAYLALVPVTWNHNTHYHPLLLRLLPEAGSAALDVGSGDGRFAALLAERFAEVLAIDPDPAQVVATAHRCSNLPTVAVRQAALPDPSVPSGHFDVVTALASFHHMPFADAACEATRVLKPGGRLVVLGVWTDHETNMDLALNIVSVALNKWLQRRRGPDAMTSPATLDRTSWRNVRALAAAHLPGSRLQRRLLWRYTIVWDKPQSA